MIPRCFRRTTASTKCLAQRAVTTTWSTPSSTPYGCLDSLPSQEPSGSHAGTPALSHYYRDRHRHGVWLSGGSASVAGVT